MYSFDIFDTLITRIVEKPTDIFDLVQEYLFQHVEKFPTLTKNVIEQYSEVRKAAEQNARRFYQDKEEINLADIYKILMKMLCIDEELSEQIKDIELHIEKNSIIPIEDNIERVKCLLNDGEHVVLISDMYLSEDVIREMMLSVDSVFEHIKIYVSSEWKATKSTGDLYRKIRQIESFEYSNWIHIGDNRVSDYDVPKMLGIDAELFEIDKSNIYLEDIDKTDFGEVKKVCTTVYRKYVKNNYISNSTIKYLGCIFTAPFLLGYVRWILEICQNNCINELLFIARDGYILKQIADYCINANELGIKTKYVYGSREIWRTNNLEKKDHIRGYFSDLLNTNLRYAFVDINGTGQSLECLGKILNIDIFAFYYTYVGSMDTTIKKLWIYDTIHGSGINEVFCRANHGKTVDYCINEKKEWAPVFCKEEVSEWKLNHMDDYFNGIMKFVKFWINNEKRVGISLNMRELGSCIYDNLCSLKYDSMKACIGELVHSDDGREGYKYAPILTKSDIDKYVLDNLSYKGFNFGLSLERSGKDKSDYYVDALQNACERVLSLKDELSADKRKFRVVLYGAGKNGKKVFLKCYQQDSIDVVCWVDSNCEKYANTKLGILSIGEIENIEYDCIFITVINNSKAIKNSLIEKGYREEMVLLPNEYEHLLYLASKNKGK